MIEENKIVAFVRYQGVYAYFAAPEDVWVLDRNAWRNMFVSEGISTAGPSPSDRLGIPIVNGETAEDFLNAVAMNKIEERQMTAALRDKVPIKDWFQVAHLFPQVYIDFDTKRLLSVHVDGLPYEKFVPLGWSGYLEDFYGEIPKEYRYWIDVDADYLSLAANTKDDTDW